MRLEMASASFQPVQGVGLAVVAVAGLDPIQAAAVKRQLDAALVRAGRTPSGDLREIVLEVVVTDFGAEERAAVAAHAFQLEGMGYNAAAAWVLAAVTAELGPVRVALAHDLWLSRVLSGEIRPKDPLTAAVVAGAARRGLQLRRGRPEVLRGLEGAARQLVQAVADEGDLEGEIFPRLR